MLQKVLLVPRFDWLRESFNPQGRDCFLRIVRQSLQVGMGSGTVMCQALAMFQALPMFQAHAPLNILNLMTVTYQNSPSTRERRVASWTDYAYHLNNSRISCLQYNASILSGAVVTTHIALYALSRQCIHFVFV